MGTKSRRTSKAATDAMIVADDPHAVADPTISAISITSAAIAAMAHVSDVSMETWRRELRYISLSAAAQGDFKAAVDGYRDIGKSLGTLTENPQQHVHFHDAQVIKEMTDDDLQREIGRFTAPAPQDAEFTTPEEEALLS